MVHIIKTRIIHVSLYLTNYRYGKFFLVCSIYQFQCAGASNGYRHYYRWKHYHVA